ncbi:hypothetical protein [Flavobacterium sp. XGLA_31]|uniref:hypothetical protein n=1 Tax=Flavobacterium sp. XGLA_31 TaxID=3447666 RepID=UPI003F3BD59A
MKKNTTLILILLFSCLTSLSQTNKLPIPTKSFIEKTQNLENFEEEYFTKYLGKKSEKILKRFSDSKDVCAKEFEFKTGIKLKTNSCSEAGIEAEIIFPNYSKNDVIKFVEWFFKNDYSKWNKSKTTYQPIEDGDAGCYLEIKELKGKITLKYSCGC